jgi:type III pantothenate kinase
MLVIKHYLSNYMNLVIDQGNTYTKFGVFDKGNLIHFYSSKKLDQAIVSPLLTNYNVENIILSSVKKTYTDTSETAKYFNINSYTRFIILDNNTPLPIINNYKTPETLGKDRIAALVGASQYYRGNPKLVIDAGTAITIDYLNEKNEFEGGNISPGIQTRFNSLHQNTNQLPLLKIEPKTAFLGKNTKEAICSGVQNGVTFEIDQYINHFSTINNNTKTILTGGDADFFAKNLKNPIFVDLNLVLTGLNTILEYNAQAK